MPLLILFIAVPIIEIALFIQVGGFIGLWPTLAIVVLTALVGTTMMRAQGLSTLARLQTSLTTGENPVDPIAHGALILVSGILLLTPGFFTDSVGLTLLFPPIRIALIKWGAAKMIGNSTVIKNNGHSAQKQDNSVLEGEYTIVDDDKNKSN